MRYRKDKYGNDLSILGFGCMRFPQKLGRIDMEQTEEQLLAAIRGGVNYFDTAYIYPAAKRPWVRSWSVTACGSRCISPPSCPIT